MAENIVSQPPLTAPIIDPNGMPSKAWAIWFRDLYRRTAYKGGNAIDENGEAIGENSDLLDETIETLEEAIAQIIANALAIIANSEAIAVNAENLIAHEELNVAHGSNGKIVGFDDLSNELLAGLVRRMATINDAVQSTVNITTADIAAAPVAYDQAYTQLHADLTNENKAAINTLVTDLNNAIAVLNNLIAASKVAGQMTTP